MGRLRKYGSGHRVERPDPGYGPSERTGALTRAPLMEGSAVAVKMVCRGRFELPTLSLRGSRSDRLSYRRIKWRVRMDSNHRLLAS